MSTNTNETIVTIPSDTMSVSVARTLSSEDELAVVNEFLDNANVYASITEFSLDGKYLYVKFNNGLTINCGMVKGESIDIQRTETEVRWKYEMEPESAYRLMFTYDQIALHYADLTAAQKEELMRPATEAAARADESATYAKNMGDNAKTQADRTQSIGDDTSDLYDIVSADHTTWTAAENTRIANENTRQANEAIRKTNENERISHENTRKSNETDRVSAESTRATNESTRQTNETNRKAAETTRASNEATRQSNETTRIANETERQSQFSASKQACNTATQNAITATNNANQATNNANTAADRVDSTITQANEAINKSNIATDLATEVATHQPIIGVDGYWYRWNTELDVYEKTDDYAKGGTLYPTPIIRHNKLYLYDLGSNILDRVNLKRNRLYMRI